MSSFSNTFVFLCACIVGVVTAKNLHVKQNPDLDDEVNLQDIYNYDDNFYTIQDRFARHVELVTESVLEHLIKEINKKYQGNNETNMIKRLTTKLRKQMRKKKKSKKRINRKKNSTTKSVTSIYDHQIS